MDCAHITDALREELTLKSLLLRAQSILDETDPDQLCPICLNNLASFTQTIASIYDLLMRRMTDSLFSAIGVKGIDDETYQTLRAAIERDPNMFRFTVRIHTNEGVSLGMVLAEDRGPAANAN